MPLQKGWLQIHFYPQIAPSYVKVKDTAFKSTQCWSRSDSFGINEVLLLRTYHRARCIPKWEMQHISVIPNSYWRLQMFSVKIINYNLNLLFSVSKWCWLFSATKARSPHICTECKQLWSWTAGCVYEGPQRNLKRHRPFFFYFRYQNVLDKPAETNYQSKALQENMWGLKKSNFKRLHIKYIFWSKSLSSHRKASAHRCKHTQSSHQPLKRFPDVLKKNA